MTPPSAFLEVRDLRVHFPTDDGLVRAVDGLDLCLERGQTLADVKLWSLGATRDGSDDEPRTTVRVGFELENQGDTPVRLDAKQLYLEEMPKSGAEPGRTPPARVEGRPRTSP